MITADITRTVKPAGRTIPGVEAAASTVETIMSGIQLFEDLNERMEAKRDGAAGIAFTGLSNFYLKVLTDKVQVGDLINSTYKVVSVAKRRRRTFLTVERLR